MSADQEAWVELPTESESRSTGRSYAYDFGRVPAMSRLIDAHPRIARRFGALYMEIMFKPGALSRTEREMVAAGAAAAQDCVY